MKIHKDKRPQGQFTYVFDIVDTEGMAYIKTFNHGIEAKKSLERLMSDLNSKIDGLHFWGFISRIYYEAKIRKLIRMEYEILHEMDRVRIDIACHLRDNYLAGSLPSAIIYKGNRVAVSLFNKIESRKGSRRGRDAFFYTSIKLGDI